jgi:hypothetical protein
MPNYQNGKIYAIRSPNCEKYYIGSTTQLLCRRMVEHRCLSHKVKSSKQIIDAGEAYIELIENFSCNNKEELRKREGELQRQFKESITNSRFEDRTPTEYTNEYRRKHPIETAIIVKKHYEKNKLHIDNYKKNHYEENKEHYKEYKKEWYQKNKLKRQHQQQDQ